MRKMFVFAAALGLTAQSTSFGQNKDKPKINYEDYELKIDANSEKLDGIHNKAIAGPRSVDDEKKGIWSIHDKKYMVNTPEGRKSYCDDLVKDHERATKEANEAAKKDNPGKHVTVGLVFLDREEICHPAVK